MPYTRGTCPSCKARCEAFPRRTYRAITPRLAHGRSSNALRHADSGGYMQDQATWYVSQDGHQIGPLTTDQIMAMAEQSQLRSEDHVWRPGFEDWQRAADVPGPIRPPPLPTPATSLRRCPRATLHQK